MAVHLRWAVHSRDNIVCQPVHRSTVVCKALREAEPPHTTSGIEARDKENLGWLLPRQLIATFAAGASLGPMLDGLHSSNDVLHYHDPFIFQLPGYQLETCWWVPVLFGIAGIIIGTGVPVLDLLTSEPKQTATSKNDSASSNANLTWATVLLCISFFVAQYALSGVLSQSLSDHPHLGPLPLIDVILAAYAIVHFLAFGRDLPVFILSFATFISGPLIEILLINGPNLYHYERPDVYGIPTWIAWVYFCGGPAVGNLGRITWRTLLEQKQAQKSS